MPTFLTEPQWYDKNGVLTTPEKVVTQASNRANEYFGPQTDDFFYLLQANSSVIEDGDNRIGTIQPAYEQPSETGDLGLKVNLGQEDAPFNAVYANSFVGEISLAKKATNADKINAKNGIYKPLIDAVYPVGSIYLSVNNTSPEEFLGGTWVTFAPGQVLVGVNPIAELTGRYSNPNGVLESNPGKTGGQREVKLTIGQIPAHSHNITYVDGQSGPSNNPQGGTGSTAGTAETTSIGGGESHTNLQPYITCYMWKRTE